MSMVQLIDKHARNPLMVVVIGVSGFLFAAYAIKTFATVRDLEAYAKADDVATVQTQVNIVERQLVDLVGSVERMERQRRIDNLESKIRDTEIEIYKAERLVDSGDATDRDFEELSKFRSDLGAYKRMLDRIN